MVDCTTFIAWQDMDCMCPIGSFQISINPFECSPCAYTNMTTFTLGSITSYACYIPNFDTDSPLIILCVMAGLLAFYFGILTKAKTCAHTDEFRMLISYTHFAFMITLAVVMGTQHRKLDSATLYPLEVEEVSTYLWLLLLPQSINWISYHIYGCINCESNLECDVWDILGYYEWIIYQTICDIWTVLIVIIYYIHIYERLVSYPYTPNHYLDWSSEVDSREYQPLLVWVFVLWLMIMILYNCWLLYYAYYAVLEELEVELSKQLQIHLSQGNANMFHNMPLGPDFVAAPLPPQSIVVTPALSKNEEERIIAKTLIPFGRFSYFVYPCDVTKLSIWKRGYLRKRAIMM